MKKLLVVGAAIAALAATPAHAGWDGIGAGIAAGIIAGAIASHAQPRYIYVQPRVRYVRPRVQHVQPREQRAPQTQPVRTAPAKAPPTMG